MSKAPAAKAESMFDDLIAETNLVLSNPDRLVELTPAQQTALASVLSPTDLEIGKPVAIILFWHITHCLSCASSFGHPRYGNGAMLKRWYSRRRLFQYESLIEHRGAAFDELTHRIETSHSDVPCCEKCFHAPTADDLTATPIGE